MERYMGMWQVSEVRETIERMYDQIWEDIQVSSECPNSVILLNI